MEDNFNRAKCILLRDYRTAIENTECFNKNQLIYTQLVEDTEITISEYLWLMIPKEIAKYLTLRLIREIGPENINYDISQSERDSKNPWIKIPAATINLSPGFHMYEFIFDNIELDVTQTYYFCYQLQLDNPDKPYVYMNRSGNND